MAPTESSSLCAYISVYILELPRRNAASAAAVTDIRTAEGTAAAAGGWAAAAGVAAGGGVAAAALGVAAAAGVAAAGVAGGPMSGAWAATTFTVERPVYTSSNAFRTELKRYWRSF